VVVAVEPAMLEPIPEVEVLVGAIVAEEVAMLSMGEEVGESSSGVEFFGTSRYNSFACCKSLSIIPWVLLLVLRRDLAVAIRLVSDSAFALGFKLVLQLFAVDPNIALRFATEGGRSAFLSTNLIAAALSFLACNLSKNAFPSGVCGTFGNFDFNFNASVSAFSLFESIFNRRALRVEEATDLAFSLSLGGNRGSCSVVRKLILCSSSSAFGLDFDVRGVGFGGEEMAGIWLTVGFWVVSKVFLGVFEGFFGV